MEVRRCAWRYVIRMNCLNIRQMVGKGILTRNYPLSDHYHKPWHCTYDHTQTCIHIRRHPGTHSHLTHVHTHAHTHMHTYTYTTTYVHTLILLFYFISDSHWLLQEKTMRYAGTILRVMDLYLQYQWHMFWSLIHTTHTHKQSHMRILIPQTCSYQW